MHKRRKFVLQDKLESKGMCDMLTLSRDQMEKFERERNIKEKTIGHDAKAAKHAGELFHFAHV